MNTPTHTSPPLKTALAALSKADLLARLKALPCAPGFALETCPAERLRLELSTHQIELEVQNQELRESRQEIEEARDRYSDLYDFAPIGYLTLDAQGCVREINLTGADMLGSERASIIGKPLLLWLHMDSHQAFHLHLKRVFATSERLVNELMLRGEQGAARHISMASNAITHGPSAGHACRTALVDITPLKDKEEKLTRSRQKLRTLSAHLDRVREEDRRHLAREVHDELGQKLTALRFEVALLGNEKKPTQAVVSRIAASLLKQVDETIESVRAIASHLRPAVLDLGLVAAIEWQIREFQQRTGIVCELKLADEDFDLDNERATAVFRIVQESLTNIARHADASRVKLGLDQVGNRLILQINDNGVGLAPGSLKKSRSFGIAGMRERVRLLGGDMKISGSPGEGTLLKVAIPLR